MLLFWQPLFVHVTSQAQAWSQWISPQWLAPSQEITHCELPWQVISPHELFEPPPHVSRQA